MKSHSLLFFISTGVVSAAAPSLPSFSEALKAPPLSLLESVKPGQIPLFEPEARGLPKSVRSAAPNVTRYVSRMPVIEPSKAIDRNMPIVTPQPDTNFAMIVKEPNVDLVNDKAPANRNDPVARE